VQVRYYVDPDTRLPHIYRHGVTEREVEEVLEHPGEDRPAHEGARSAIGRTGDGRYVRVIYVRDAEPGSLFVITAYLLEGKPLLAYRRRRRRKGSS
jgi:hypothetical protein